MPTVAEDLFRKLQAAVEASEVGVELWFDSGEWRREKQEGRSFVDWFLEILGRDS